MAAEFGTPRLGAASVLEAAAESGPAVHLDQEFARFHVREPLIDPLLEGHDALGALLGLERCDDEVTALHPDTGIAGQ